MADRDDDDGVAADGDTAADDTSAPAGPGDLDDESDPDTGRDPVLDKESKAEARSRKRLTIALVVLILVLGALLPVARCVANSDDGPEITAVEVGPRWVETEDRSVRESGQPTLRISPQRARAGSPLELAARGTGCGGRNAVVSVVALGRATDTVDDEGSAPPDRLVARRRVDVSPTGDWATSPLLVGQPVGAYRVTAACDRRSMLDGVEPVEGRRDVFVAAELLELTGPAVLYDLDVAPSVAAPGEPVTVQLSGRGQCPAGSPVSGTVFPTPGTPGEVRRFNSRVRPDGTWSTTVAIPARQAFGAYGVEAVCGSGFAFATKSLRFPGPEDSATTPLVPVGPGSGTSVPGPARPVPGQPTYTG